MQSLEKGWSMSPDELILLIMALGLALWGWIKWYSVVYSVWQPINNANRLAMSILPLVALIVISIVVGTVAAFDVVGSPIYTFFYITLGLAWLVPARGLLFMLFDISWRDDVIERGNTAATAAVWGGLLGLTAIYAGANVGDGPGWWVVVFTVIAGTALWFGFGSVFHRLTGAYERITVDRDLGTGLRTAFYFLSSGIVLGRACAGDWISAERTLVEFWQAWPTLLILGLALIVERRINNSTDLEEPTKSAVLWGVTYLLLALAALFLFPSMTQNPWWRY